MQLNFAQPGFRIPCQGVSLRRTEKNWGVLRIHYSADPDLVTPAGEPTEKLLDLRDRISNEADWKLEMEIEWEARSGQLVYPEFDPRIHVIPDEDVPAKMVRYMSIDPHPRTPHAILWAGVDRWNDVYVYREYWPSNVYGQSRAMTDSEKEKHADATVKHYAETIAFMEGNRLQIVNENDRWERGRYIQQPSGERIYKRFMDQAAKGFLLGGENDDKRSISIRYRDYGIHCQDPNKRHRAGQDQVHAYLQPRHHQAMGMWPRLHITNSCRELIMELGNFRYKQTRRLTEERELKQDPVEARCHEIDNLRYLLTADISYVHGWES
jgi:hypothetical protein